MRDQTESTCGGRYEEPSRMDAPFRRITGHGRPCPGGEVDEYPALPQELRRPHPAVSHNISNEIDDRVLLVRHILESFGCVVNDSGRAEGAEKVGVARGPGCGHDSSQPPSKLDRKVSITTAPGVDEHTLPGLHASGFYRSPCG